MPDLPERQQFYIPVQGDSEYNSIQIVIRQSKGGMNFASYRQNPVGVVVSMTPVTQKDDGTISYQMFTGLSSLVEPCKRLNRKKIQQYADTARKHIEEEKGEFWLLFQKVCSEHGLSKVKE